MGSRALLTPGSEPSLAPIAFWKRVSRIRIALWTSETYLRPWLSPRMVARLICLLGKDSPLLLGPMRSEPGLCECSLVNSAPSGLATFAVDTGRASMKRWSRVRNAQNRACPADSRQDFHYERMLAQIGRRPAGTGAGLLD